MPSASRHRTDDQVWITNAGESDEDNAVREWSTIPAATSTARRVLPMPPGPSSVTRRFAASKLTHFGDLALATDEAAERRRQDRRRRRARLDVSALNRGDGGRRGLEHTPIGFGQTERLGQAAYRRRVGVRSGGPLEVGDTTRAQCRALGQRLLGQPGGDAVTAEDFAEPDFLLRFRTWHRRCPHTRPDARGPSRLEYSSRSSA